MAMPCDWCAHLCGLLFLFGWMLFRHATKLSHCSGICILSKNCCCYLIIAMIARHTIEWSNWVQKRIGGGLNKQCSLYSRTVWINNGILRTGGRWFWRKWFFSANSETILLSIVTISCQLICNLQPFRFFFRPSKPSVLWQLSPPFTIFRTRLDRIFDMFSRSMRVFI